METKETASEWFWRNVMRQVLPYPRGTFPEKIEATFIQKPAKMGHSLFKKLTNETPTPEA